MREDSPYLPIDTKKLSLNVHLSIRSHLLQTKRQSIIDENAFKFISKQVLEKTTISYDKFKATSLSVPENAKKYFTSRNFLLFPRDTDDCIDSEELIKYIERSIEVEHIMLDLMECSSRNTEDPLSTTISEYLLETYIFSMIPQLDAAQRLHPSFYPFYVYTASQKFFFFLDPHKVNSIPIKKLANSVVMSELLYLKRLAKLEQTLDPQDFEVLASANWFHGGNALRIYSRFLDLDKDQNGMLNYDEIKEYFGFLQDEQCQFTMTALRRIFEEYISFQPVEMDYKAFVNLVLALENNNAPESIRYFWRVIDYDKSGLLTSSKIRYFYNEIRDQLIDLNYDAPTVDHVILEIYDMLACNNLEGATFQNIIESKQGSTVLLMLLDVQAFWRYDNREDLMVAKSKEPDDKFTTNDDDN